MAQKSETQPDQQAIDEVYLPWCLSAPQPGFSFVVSVLPETDC